MGDFFFVFCKVTYANDPCLWQLVSVCEFTVLLSVFFFFLSRRELRT